MKVWEYLDFVCDLKGFPKNKQARKEHIGTVCRQTGIDKLTGRMIRNLSKGYRQRVGFAQALIGNPKVLILDEPTVGLDPSQIMEIRQLIRDAGRESTVIVSSHILSEIQAICSRILVIHGGKIAADGTPEELLANASAGAELSVRVKGSPEQIEAVLRSLNGIASFTHAGSPEEGAEEYLLTKENAAASSPVMDKMKEQSRAESGIADLREQVFLAFAKAGLPILELSSREATLEQVFLHLTDQEPSVPKKGGEPHGSDL